MRLFLLIPLVQYALVSRGSFCNAVDVDSDPEKVSIPIIDKDDSNNFSFRNARHLFRARQPIYTGVHYAWQNPIRTAPTLSPRRNLTTTTTESPSWGQSGDRDRDQFQTTERDYYRPNEGGEEGEAFRPTQPYPPVQPEREPWERPPFRPTERERQSPYRPPQREREPFRPVDREQEPYQPGREPFRPSDREGESYRPEQRPQGRPTDRDREQFRPTNREPFRPPGREPLRPDERERQPYRPTDGEREQSRPSERDRDRFNPNERDRNTFQPSERERDQYRPTQRPPFQPTQGERDQSQQIPTVGTGRNPGSEYDNGNQRGSESSQGNLGTPSSGNRCPQGSRLLKGTRRCYELGSKGPCNENMAFYQDPDKEELGYCDCFQEFNRPVVYHRETDRCYFVFQQAYCQDREWLILDPKLNFHPMCDINRCFTWTQANAPNWNWRNNGAELDMRGPVALLNEAYCVELQWPCARESRENEKLTELLVPRKNERSRDDIVLKFDGPDLVCRREMSVEFPGFEFSAFRLQSGGNYTSTSALCRKGLYSKMRSEGQCEGKVLL